jgi:hypothetical protein
MDGDCADIGRADPGLRGAPLAKQTRAPAADQESALLPMQTLGFRENVSGIPSCDFS